jgi:adenosine kinase
MLDLLATGYPSLDHIVPVSHIPSVGQTALLGTALEQATVTYGGCGANVAVALQKLGFHTGLALVLGDDIGGEEYRAQLLRLGVDCRNVRMLTGEATSTSYLCRAPDGEMVNFFYPGAADAWQGTLALEGLDAVRWGLVTVGYAPYNCAFVEQLGAAHIPLIWQMKGDVAAYPRAVVEQFIAASRILFCNRFEADYVCRTLGLADLREVFTQGVEQVVLTLGGDGSLVMTPQHDEAVPAVPALIVDTTGAGDAYTAGYLAGMWRGYTPAVCGRLGAAAAAFVIEALGCQTNLPDWAALQGRYEDHFGAL